jgi:hypothetical protein
MDYNPVANNTQYCLSIRFFPDGFSLFVSGEDKKTVVSRHINAAIAEMSTDGILDLLSAQQEFSMSFGTVRVIVESDYYSIVPAGVLRDGDEAAMLRFAFSDLPGNFTVIRNELLPWGAVLLYALPVNLNEALQTTLPELVPEHHLSAFMADNVALSADTFFYAFFRSGQADLMVFDEGKPLLVNSFQCATAEDLLYYVLKIAGQYNLDTYRSSMEIHNADRKISYQNVLEKYFLTCKIYHKQ